MPVMGMTVMKTKQSATFGRLWREYARKWSWFICDIRDDHVCLVCAPSDTDLLNKAVIVKNVCKSKLHFNFVIGTCVDESNTCVDKSILNSVFVTLNVGVLLHPDKFIFKTSQVPCKTWSISVLWTTLRCIILYLSECQEPICYS